MADAITLNDIAVTLDDIAGAITGLGTMMGRQLEDLRQEVSKEFAAMRLEMNAEFQSVRQEIRDARLALIDVKHCLSKVEALRNDIKEIYDRIAKLEQWFEQADPQEYPAIRRELREIQAWARQISTAAGLPAPKF